MRRSILVFGVILSWIRIILHGSMAIWTLLQVKVVKASNGGLWVSMQRQLSRLWVEDDNSITATSVKLACDDLLKLST